MRVNTSYPTSILRPVSGTLYYRFDPVVSYLFSLVTDADIDDIDNCKIYRRSFPQYIPWYSSASGGGAITLGNGLWSRIYFTENFFSDDQQTYGGCAYLHNPITWLSLATHEVSHIAHGRRFGSIVIYLIIFIYQYVLYGHDKAPLEQEADAGTSLYHRFSNYVNVNLGLTLPELIISQMSEEEKILSIKKSWAEFSIL